MPTARDAFLSAVRSAVMAGNQAGHQPALPTGPRVAYQGGGPDPVQRFSDELKAAGGVCHVVKSPREAVDRVVDIVTKAGAKKAVMGRADVLNRMQLAPSLRVRGVEVWEEADRPFDPSLTELPAESAKEVLFAADVGITGVDALIAETGSIVIETRAGQARSLSLLPPLHIAVAERGQLIPDLFDVFDPFPPLSPSGGEASGVRGANIPHSSPPHPGPLPQGGEGARGLPSCLTLITGPSKTGDIELRLVTGVHGPGEVHVVLIDS